MSSIETVETFDWVNQFLSLGFKSFLHHNRLVITGILLAREFSCYKLNVVCKDELSEFYKSFGWVYLKHVNTVQKIQKYSDICIHS